MRLWSLLSFHQHHWDKTPTARKLYSYCWVFVLLLTSWFYFSSFPQFSISTPGCSWIRLDLPGPGASLWNSSKWAPAGLSLPAQSGKSHVSHAFLSAEGFCCYSSQDRPSAFLFRKLGNNSARRPKGDQRSLETCRQNGCFAALLSCLFFFFFLTLGSVIEINRLYFHSF